jgi:hypothetical protein
VMQGFGLGIEDERRMIQRQLQDITKDLPTWTGGPPRGGDGAATGSVTVVLQPGALQINGQGREAGEEAAAAFLEALAQAQLVR